MPKHWVSKSLDGRWIHWIEGNKEIEERDEQAGIYDHWETAWQAAKAAARQDGSEAFLQGENGRIRRRNSYRFSLRDVEL